MYKLTIPQYITQIKISESRRAKPFRYSERESLPLKYSDELATRYIWKKDKLWDTVEKEFVAKNSKTAGTPRFMTISGNEIYARMHERLRMKIVAGIKDNFRPYLTQLPKPLPTPLIVSMELHCPPGYSNWDLDNLWIYNKCLQDLLQQEEYLPDDNIQFITGSSAILYTPVVSEEQRRMVFTFQEDTREIVKAHNLFKRDMSPVIRITEDPFMYIDLLNLHEILESNTLEAGKIEIKNKKFLIGVGKKKILYGSVRKALGHVYSQCIQINVHPIVSSVIYDKYKKFFQEEIVDKFIQLYVYDYGDEVSDGIQNVPNEIRIGKN